MVDNASTDDSVALVRRLAPTATVVETGRNGGYAAGVNAGVRAAVGHRTTRSWSSTPTCGSVLAACRRLFDRAATGPGTGIAVPRLTDARGELIESLRREPDVAAHPGRRRARCAAGRAVAGTGARW